ncbi:MAG: alpha/beta hydrolase [Clostridiales bacterium]|nr:alpha/beta hydrolase [Clostridiales bacterium]
MLKKFLITIFSIIASVLLFLAGIALYHNTHLKKEREILSPIGQFIEVDGHNMNLYIEDADDSEHTLVFLAGTGTPSPIYDFKPLYSLLTDRYRVVVIEKFGYGYSDEVEGERTLDVITEQDREALSLAGIEAPYILVPHSSGGIEAIFWANNYPSEVEAIVGLDINVPEQYDYYAQGTSIDDMTPQDINDAVNSMAVYDFLMYKVGLMRLLMNPDSTLPALLSDALTREEKNQYRALAYTMYSEGSGATWARETIMTAHQLQLYREYVHGPIPDVPTLLLVSDGSMMAPVFGSDYTSIWRQIHRNYIDLISNGDIIELDCGHYLHAERPEEVSAAMISFIESLP